MKVQQKNLFQEYFVLKVNKRLNEIRALFLNPGKIQYIKHWKHIPKELERKKKKYICQKYALYIKLYPNMNYKLIYNRVDFRKWSEQINVFH